MLVIAFDASHVAGQKTVAEALRQAFGGIDVLFVNAGLADLRPVEQWDEAAFNRSFAIHVKGPCFLIQALLPILANPASIVLNASVNTPTGMPATSVYDATQAGAAFACATPLMASWASRTPISRGLPLPSKARFLAGRLHGSELVINGGMGNLRRVLSHNAALS